jgi:predicted outer membrane protein
MQRRTSRTLSRAVVVAVILAVGATIWQSWTAGMPGTSGIVATQWGPLSPADRDLIVKVRLACLWEMSTGQQVQQQATNPAVKEAGRKISAEHTELDQKTRDIADKLGVPLPASPNAQQLGWMKEIASKTGSDYDRTAVQRLREAHGIVLPILAEVRISTRNDLVRQFAADGTLYVTRHIRLPGVHGLVDYSALPEPPSPGLLSGSANWTDLLVPGLVLIACLLAATPDRREPARAGQGQQGGAAAADGDHVRSPGGHRPPHSSPCRRRPARPGPQRFSSTDMASVMSPGTSPGGIPDVPTPAPGIPRSRVSDSGRHAVRR